jgi:hypothetical protein
VATLTLETISPRPSLLDRLLDERREQSGGAPGGPGTRRAPTAPPAPAARPTAHAPAGPAPETPSPPAAPEGSLDELVTSVWAALGTAEAACLVCGTPLTPRYGSGAKPVAARCGGCGSELG